MKSKGLRMKNEFMFWQRALLKVGELEGCNVSVLSKETGASYSHCYQTVLWLKKKKLLKVKKLRLELALTLTTEGEKIFFKTFDICQILEKLK